MTTCRRLLRNRATNYQLLILFVACASPLIGQSSRNEYEVAAGVAVPTGLAGRNRGAWPLVRVSIQERQSMSLVRTRLDAEALWMSANAAPNSGPTHLGSLQAISVSSDFPATYFSTVTCPFMPSKTCGSH